MQRGWKTAALALIATATLTGTAFAQRGFGFGFGGGANILRIPEVQGELKLTEDQKTKVNTLLEQLRSERQGQFQQFRDLSPEERQKAMAERTAKENGLVSAILDADQMKRYHQLVLQQQGGAALATTPVADKLNLTADQRDKIQGFLRDQQEQLRGAFQPGGDPQAMQAKLAAVRKDTNDKIAGVLTDAQKAQWKEMLGAPFTFPALQFRRPNNN
jgi:Spy/CpxP family protein refolding chaperone